MTTLRDFQQQRVRAVPSAFTDPDVLLWLRQVVDAVNAGPPTSTFSLTTPESVVTALPGTWGWNLNSAVSAVWFKQSGTTTTGWVKLA